MVGEAPRDRATRIWGLVPGPWSLFREEGNVPFVDAGENAGRIDQQLLDAELALILSGATATGIEEDERD